MHNARLFANVLEHLRLGPVSTHRHERILARVSCERVRYLRAELLDSPRQEMARLHGIVSKGLLRLSVTIISTTSARKTNLSDECPCLTKTAGQ